MLKKVVFKPKKIYLQYLTLNADALHRRCALTGLGKPVAWTQARGYHYPPVMQTSLSAKR